MSGVEKVWFLFYTQNVLCYSKGVPQEIIFTQKDSTEVHEFEDRCITVSHMTSYNSQTYLTPVEYNETWSFSRG